MVNYWDRLEPEMTARKMKIPALAKKLGISYPAVAKVRDGGSFGSENNIAAAKLFGLEPEWLASGKGPKFALKEDASQGIFRPSTPEEVERMVKVLNREKDNVRETLVHLAHAISLMEPSSRQGLIPLFAALTIGPDSAETLDAIAEHIEKAPAKIRADLSKHETPEKNSNARAA